MKFFYQLQAATVESLSTRDADFIIMDRDRDDGTSWTFHDVEAIQKATGAKVLCYLSIGEAENYRSYWDKNNKGYIGEENPDWPGNFRVQYWHQAWQQQIGKVLELIIRAGFDGVYLDTIDTYEYWVDRSIQGARNEMIEFVRALSKKAKLFKDDFMIVPQNGIDLLASPSYRVVIDGIGVENLILQEDGKRQPEKTIGAKGALLDLLLKEGKPVLCTEYTDNKAVSLAIRNMGYAAFLTNVELTGEVYE